MSRWEDQPVGTWELVQFVRPGRNGQCEELGYFGSFRHAFEAAEKIAKISTLEGGFSATYKRSDDRTGASVDGYSQHIDFDDPPYDPDMRVTLKNGTTIWFSELEQSLALANEILGGGHGYQFTYDLVYALTTNGSDTMYVEDRNGEVLAERSTYLANDEDLERIVAELFRAAEDHDPLG